MLEKLDTIRMAQALTGHAAQRARIVAGNVANADTPGFRARDARPFAETYRHSGAVLMRATRPGHLAAMPAATATARLREDEGGRAPNGNSVSLEAEMVKSAEVKREHDLSVAIYKSALGLMRSAAGRRG
ncbi:MAG: FlgB family protein [Paracoccus sp. (in: a-proteobacteria)]|nr:FlgB family protein [Paracoccus sp. (in: a-proteobacteria)]